MSIPSNCASSAGHDYSLLFTATPQSPPARAACVKTNSGARHLAKRSELSLPLNTPRGPLRTSMQQGLIWPDRVAHHHAQVSQGLAQPTVIPGKRWSEVLAEQISRPPYTQRESLVEQRGKPHKQPWSEVLAEQLSRPPFTQRESLVEQRGKPHNQLWSENFLVEEALENAINHLRANSSAPGRKPLFTAVGTLDRDVLKNHSNHCAVRIPKSHLVQARGNEQPLRAPNTSRAAPPKAMILNPTATPTLALAMAQINPVHGQKDQVLDRFLDALLRMNSDVASQHKHFGLARQKVTLQRLLKDQVAGLNIIQTQRVLAHLRNGLSDSARAIAEDAHQRLAQGTSAPSKQPHLSSLAQADHLADSLFKALNRKLKVPISELRPSNTLPGNPSRLSAGDKQALIRLSARQTAQVG